MNGARFAIALLLILAGSALAQEKTAPFALPVPEGWRTETIPFPLEFAPQLPYSGLEELRFAPGMFEEGSPELWTYCFVWWVERDDPNDPESLSEHLEGYFRGLAAAVAESRQVEVGDAAFSASLTSGEPGEFTGVAETFDAFVTHGQVRLNVRGAVWACPASDRQAIFFALSPQSTDHDVWDRLDSIRSGFRCIRDEGKPAEERSR